MTEEPETITKINQENLSWTTCSVDQCGIHRLFKKTLNGIQKNIYKKTGKKPNISNKFYPTKTPDPAVMMIKIGKSEIPTLITRNTENIISTSFENRIKKCLDNECIKIGEKTIQYITIESKYGILGSTSFKI